MPHAKLCLWLTLGSLIAPRASLAAGSCSWNQGHTYYSCNGAFSGAESGTGAPTLEDAFTENPGTLPALPTPLGVEGSYSSRSADPGHSNFSGTMLKGFQGLGLGIGTWANGTFNAPDLADLFQHTSLESAYQNDQADLAKSKARFAAAVAVPSQILPSGITVKVGGSVGASSQSGMTNSEIGAVINLLGLAGSFATGAEYPGDLLPKVSYSILTLGARLSSLFFGYSYQVLSASGVNNNSASRASIRWTRQGWSGWANLKWQKNQLGQNDSWARLGAAWNLGTHLSLAYEYGQFRYAHSVLAQFFF